MRKTCQMLVQHISIWFTVSFLMGKYKTACPILYNWNLHSGGLEILEKVLQNIFILIQKLNSRSAFPPQPACDSVKQSHILGAQGGGCYKPILRSNYAPKIRNTDRNRNIIYKIYIIYRKHRKNIKYVY